MQAPARKQAATRAATRTRPPQTVEGADLVLQAAAALRPPAAAVAAAGSAGADGGDEAAPGRSRQRSGSGGRSSHVAAAGSMPPDANAPTDFPTDVALQPAKRTLGGGDGDLSVAAGNGADAAANGVHVDGAWGALASGSAAEDCGDATALAAHSDDGTKSVVLAPLGPLEHARTADEGGRRWGRMRALRSLPRLSRRYAASRRDRSAARSSSKWQPRSARVVGTAQPWSSCDSTGSSTTRTQARRAAAGLV